MIRLTISFFSIALTKAVFAQACELLGSLLKARREHLRRAVSNVTVTCSRLLDDLRRLKASGAPDDVIRACAAKLSFVYEAAESSGLERYCTHLLADVISAITGGGIGVQTRRFRPPRRVRRSRAPTAPRRPLHRRRRRSPRRPRRFHRGTQEYAQV